MSVEECRVKANGIQKEEYSQNKNYEARRIPSHSLGLTLEKHISFKAHSLVKPFGHGRSQSFIASDLLSPQKLFEGAGVCTTLLNLVGEMVGLEIPPSSNLKKMILSKTIQN